MMKRKENPERAVYIEERVAHILGRLETLDALEKALDEVQHIYQLDGMLDLHL